MDNASIVMDGRAPVDLDKELTLKLEAVLFAAGEPLSVSEAARTTGVPKKRLTSALRRLQAEYDDGDRGMRVKLFGDFAQLVTREKYSEFVKLLTTPIVKQPLRQAVLETLAAIAYRQPVTRAEIDQARGVKSDSAMRTLLELGLIKELGKRDTLGHPMEFGTTDKFLGHFGLQTITELPISEEERPADTAEQTSFLV